MGLKKVTTRGAPDGKIFVQPDIRTGLIEAGYRPDRTFSKVFEKERKIEKSHKAKKRGVESLTVSVKWKERHFCFAVVLYFMLQGFHMRSRSSTKYVR